MGKAQDAYGIACDPPANPDWESLLPESYLHESVWVDKACKWTSVVCASLTTLGGTCANLVLMYLILSDAKERHNHIRGLCMFYIVNLDENGNIIVMYNLLKFLRELFP